ncbi:MAG: hypothetical protein ACYC9S_00305 [Leptospirales bacterium]
METSTKTSPVPSVARRSVFWILAVALLFLSVGGKPRAAHADSSGTGTWNLLLFGNYDLSSLDTGNIATSSLYNTLQNSLGTATSFANNFKSGYGAGLAIVYWFNDLAAFRVGVQGNIFPGKTAGQFSGDSVQSAPLFGGFEARLLGNQDYYLYGVVDGGAAYEDSVTGSSPTLSNSISHAWTAYADVGLGLNLNLLFVEVKFAYMPQFVPAYGQTQNGFYYVPVTAGFNF